MVRQIRILITTGIFPPEVGGPATILERLGSDLVGAGFYVTVLTYGAPEKKARPFKLVSVSRNWFSPLRHLFFAARTFFLARQADIIYTTDLYSPGFYSMIAAKFCHKKFVVRFAGDSAWETALNRGLSNDDILTFQEKTYGSFIEKLKRRRTKILKSADAVVAVSDFIKNLAVKIGVRKEKIHVIYNAVDFLGKLPERQKPDFPILVTACRLTPWKGVEMLIRVMARLKDKYPDIKFEILGEGSQEESLKSLVKSSKLEKNVNFRGRVSQSEILSIFAHSTIFVLNTNYEGLSHTILEAMSVGIPVITTPVGGNPELIKDNENGLLVKYNDEAVWQTAIERLLNEESLQEKFIANSRKVLEKFKWDELLQKTANVFNELNSPV